MVGVTRRVDEPCNEAVDEAGSKSTGESVNGCTVDGQGECCSECSRPSNALESPSRGMWMLEPVSAGTVWESAEVDMEPWMHKMDKPDR